MDQIRAYFEKMVIMTDADWQVFSSRLSRAEYPKKSVILQTEHIEQHLSFIEKGLIRFFVPKMENEITFSFSFPGEFVSAYDSFLTQTPSGYQVETLAATILWQISSSDLQTVYEQTKIGNTIGRLASELLYLDNIKRELSLLTDSAEQRYLNLLTEQPHLIQNIPLKYLASYIGITPQALSRIRRRIY